MPVYIGDYLADTMHLTTEQHGAYLLLLFHLWRRGSLPANDALLARITGLGADRWSMTREVLAEFFEIREGRWHHGRVERERVRIGLKQEANSKKAKTAALGRWQKAHPADATEDASSNPRNGIEAMLDACKSEPHSQAEADAETDPEEYPSSEAGQDPFFAVDPEKDTPSKRIHGHPEPVKGSDPRHARFREILGEYWRYKNHGSPEMPWQGRDAKALSEFLSASPMLTEEQFRQLLRNRAKSAVAHGDRVYLWIGNLTRYQEEIGPYNKPVSAGGGSASRAEINRNSVVNAVGEALELAREHARRVGQTGHEPATLLDGGMPSTDGAGPGRCAVALPGAGHRGMAEGSSADGKAGADGPLPYRAPTQNAGGAFRTGRAVEDFLNRSTPATAVSHPCSPPQQASLAGDPGSATMGHPANDIVLREKATEPFLNCSIPTAMAPHPTDDFVFQEKAIEPFPSCRESQGVVSRSGRGFLVQ